MLSFLVKPRASQGCSGKESFCNAGDTDLIPGLGRSHGGGNSNPVQYSCLENPMERGAWRATVHGIARVGHDLVTKPLNQDNLSSLQVPMKKTVDCKKERKEKRIWKKKTNKKQLSKQKQT